MALSDSVENVLQLEAIEKYPADPVDVVRSNPSHHLRALLAGWQLQCQLRPMFCLGQCWRGHLCFCRTQGRYHPQAESLAGNNVGKLVCSCDAKGRSCRFAFPLSSACSVAAYA